MKKALLALFASLSVILQGQNLEGLWLVEQMSMNDEIMTPQARWVRFNADGTTESGNGWRQHTVGTYSLKDDMLSLESSNGFIDKAGAFAIVLEGDQMTWTRMEDGMEVKVNLKRIDKLPRTTGDHMLGLWKLESSSNVFEGEQPSIKLQIRWDNLFVWIIETDSPKRIYGVYSVHGHRHEIVLKSEDLELAAMRLNVSFPSENEMVLSAEGGIEMRFSRAYEF
ncbi:hypothetical protein [Phaeocystidibacter luteus]|uniref:Lipocalin-like domain-containing protein n=1 Tax=Phaeocystidibacter luteus TaxID=911197 RepID=A0A6N6RKJ4_9FLAO|nr:hypothetical protein [Phaeocystidibacter luteus]KAB2810250.1 hypothetical protein F8C67_06610 [Phaeocystidibacter luteus]